MAKRKVKTVTNGDKVATVYRDPEWNEYVVKLKGRPQADYFTSDRDDAEGTAKHMVGLSGLGMHHDSRKVNRRALISREKKTKVTVSISRSMTGNFTAMACAAHAGNSVKARHCGGLAGGPTPTSATARALRSLADTLTNER